MSKRAFKTEPAPCRKSPQEGPHPREEKKKKREREKREKGKQKREKERKIIVIKKDSTNKKCLSYGQIEPFCLQCPAKQRQQAMPINPK